MYVGVSEIVHEVAQQELHRQGDHLDDLRIRKSRMAHGCKLRVGDPAERLDQPLCEADRRVASRVGGAPPAVEGNLFL